MSAENEQTHEHKRKKNRKKRSFIRRAVKFAVMAGLFFAFFITMASVAVYYVFTYPAVQKRVIAFAEEKISEYIIGDITIDKIETNLISYINIYGIKAVGKSEYRDSAYAGQVRINYWLGLGSLVSRHFHITSAHITDVRGHVVMENAGELGGRIMLPFLPLKNLDSNYNMLSKFRTVEFQYREMRKNLEDYKKIPRHLRQTLSIDMPDPRSWPIQISVGRAQVDGINGVYRDLQNNMVGEIKNASATARFYEIDSFSVRLRVPFASYESPWWSGTVDTLNADGVITWKDLEVYDMLLSGSGTRVTGRGKLSYFPDGPWDMTANFKTVVDPLPIFFEYTPQLAKGGTFEGTASYRGRLYDPIWNAAVTGRNVEFAGVTVHTMNVDASYGLDEIGRARIRGSTGIGRFDVNADVTMRDIVFGPDEFGDYQATVVLSDLDMETILGEFDVSSPFTISGGTVRINGNGTNFEIPEEVTLAIHADLGGFYGVDIRGVVRENGAYTLNGVLGENRIADRGNINWETGDVRGNVTVSMTDPAPLTNALTGEHVTGHVAINGDYAFRLDNASAIRGNAQLTGNGVMWRGLLADSIEATVKLANGVATLESANGHVSGPIDWATEYIGYNTLLGDIAADFSMHGDLGKLENLFLNVYLRGSDLRYNDIIADTITGFINMDSGKVNWNNLYARGMGMAVESVGNFLFYPHTELHTTADIFHIQNGAKVPAGNIRVDGTIIGNEIAATYRAMSMPLVMLDAWIPEEHRSSGALSLEGTFGGTVENPSARVSYRIEDPNYANKFAAHLVRGDAEFSDSLINARAALLLKPDAAPVEITAALPLSPSAGWTLEDAGGRAANITARSAGLEVFHITDLFEELADIDANGEISFDITAANRRSPAITAVDAENVPTSDITAWGLSGTLSIPNGSLRHVPTEADINRVRLAVNMGGTVASPRAAFNITSGRARSPELRVDRVFISGYADLEAVTVDSSRFTFIDDGIVALRGKLRYDNSTADAQNGNFNAAFNIINLPAEVFANYMPEFEIYGGTATGSGNISGSFDRPQVSGALRISDINFAINDISPTVGPIDASIEFADSTIRLLWATGRWGRGYLSAEGTSNWNAQGFVNTDISSTINNITFELPEVIYVGLERADLQIVDDRGGFLVRGRATLGPTNYVRDVSILEMISHAQIGGGAGVHRAPNPLFEMIRLRVDLDLAENMGIDMNLGNLSMDGRLTVVGNLAEPGIVGRISIVDGYVYYIDRRFNIIDGSLFNPDVTAFNPTIRILAQTDVVTYSQTSRLETFTINLSMSGTLEEPVIAFTSDPPLSELDILSILTFGERLGGMGGDMNNRLANITAQQVIGLGTRRLEKILDVDRISVTGNVVGSPTSAETGEGVTIGVTRRFTDRLNVIYEINTGGEINQRATAQYRLLRNVFLEGETSGSENSVNLTFRYSR